MPGCHVESRAAIGSSGVCCVEQRVSEYCRHHRGMTLRSRTMQRRAAVAALRTMRVESVVVQEELN